jgi:hypothetical protein
MNPTVPPETLARLKKSLSRERILDWALLAGGILSALVGLGAAVSGGLTLGSARTEGTVIRVEPEGEVVTVPDYDGYGSAAAYPVVVYYPVVEYQVGDHKYAYRSRWDSHYYAVGQQVPLVYKVDRPEVARIDSFSDRWLDPLTFGGPIVVLGVFFVVVSACHIWMHRKLEEKIRAWSQTESN